MEKLKKCRICLLENVRMYVVANKNLQEIYEKLTDVPFVTEDSRPTLACVFCCSKLKQCYELQRKCLEAEELFAQLLKEEYETKPLINQDQLEFSTGFNITPTVQISKVDECQTESIAIKEELPAVYEGLDDIIEPKEEPQSDELENLDTSYLDVEHVPPHRSESDLEDDVPLMKFKIEVEEEQEESENNPTTSETTKLVNLGNSCLDVAYVPPHHSESDLEDDVPLMEFKIEVEEEQEESKNNPTTSETTRTNVAKKLKLENAIKAEQTKKEKSDSEVIRTTQKRATIAKEPKLDTLRTNLEDAITAAQTKKEKSDSKVIRTTQKRTSEPGTHFKEPYRDQRSLNRVNKTIQHTRTQIGEKPYKCDVCQRTYSEKCLLLKHMRVHSGAKPFKCELCERSFRQLCHLKSHVLIHTGEKPYNCNVCQRSFSKKSYLAIHVRIHTGEKPYKCDLCQRSFSQKGHLTIHIRIHAGEKPYKCDVCERNFSKKCDLTKHNRIHTGEKPFKCQLCEQSFRQNVHLTNHLRVHHAGEKLLKRSGA